LKDASQWKAKDATKKPQVTPEILAFLTRAQAIADAFYPAGAAQPHLTYTLRPKLDSSLKDWTLTLTIDGQVREWTPTSSLQKQFTWPVQAEAKDQGAVGRIGTGDGGLSTPFASRGGLWGIFRIMGDAEPRPLSAKIVEWKYLRSGDGRLEALRPPAQMEIVEFPGGMDVFNPKFFEGFQCPPKAVQ
jgi:type VI protein secretion system component VasK